MGRLKCRKCGAEFPTLPEWKRHSRLSHDSVATFDVVFEPGEIPPNPNPTPRLADESKKLLDNGWSIIIYTNAMGSYTAMATKTPLSDVIHQFEKKTGLKTSVITDDFEPSAALYRLTEKVFGNIV